MAQPIACGRGSTRALLVALLLVVAPLRSAAGSGDHLDGTGFVIVQIDGLSEPALHSAIASGDLPFISRMLSTTHALTAWETLLPSTTPASQGAILHGDSSDVPGFRWWQRDQGRIVDMHVPEDARRVERRITGPRELLRGDGASIMNLFTGGAPRPIFTVSQAMTSPLGPGAWSPAGDPRLFSAMLVRSLGAVGSLAIRSVSREAPLPTTAPGIGTLGSGLTGQLILAEMRRGTRVIYASLVAFDSVAHHVGTTGWLARRSLQEADDVVKAVADSSLTAPRQYQIILLSDHGQTAGASFESEYGQSLEDLVRSLMSEPFDGTAHEVGLPPDVAVAPSGNLANVSFPRHDHRLSLEELEILHPGLLASLAAHPGIGFVLVRSRREGLLAMGPAGIHYLDSGQVSGIDPLVPFGAHAAASLRRLGAFREVGDIVVNSLYDTERDVVAPFEAQVSSHGGLGGDQTKAFLAYPRGFEVVGYSATLVGAEAVNARLREWGVSAD